VFGLVTDATPSTERLFAIHALGFDATVSYLETTDPSLVLPLVIW
jgi:hypothetical protein